MDSFLSGVSEHPALRDLRLTGHANPVAVTPKLMSTYMSQLESLQVRFYTGVELAFVANMRRLRSPR